LGYDCILKVSVKWITGKIREGISASN